MLQIAFVGAFAARLQGLVQDRVGVPCRGHRGRRGRDHVEPGRSRRAGHPRVQPGDGRGGPPAQARAGAGRRPRPDRPAGAPARRLAGERLRPRGGHRRVRDRRDPDVEPGALPGGYTPAAGRMGFPVGGRLAAATAARARREDARRPRLRADRAGSGPAGPGVRHGDLGHPARCDAAGILRGGLSRRTGGPGRAPETRRLPGRDLAAHARDPRPPRPARTRVDEADRGPGQRRASRDRRRGGALRRPSTEASSPERSSTSGTGTRPAPGRRCRRACRSTSSATC